MWNGIAPFGAGWGFAKAGQAGVPYPFDRAARRRRAGRFTPHRRSPLFRPPTAM